MEEEPPAPDSLIWPDNINGVRYEIDEHVFVSPPYSQRSGEPYLVARILDFVRPKIGEASHTEPRVKLAFYLRPRDISSRYIADHRVLLATMHADDTPISYIRGKCRVHHKERLPTDIESYKREPDSFYYHQLYDRYLHRYFDLIPTERVQNAPPEAIAYLNEHFEFVCCEVGMGHELSDSLRGCHECRKWASNAESVTCVVCKKIWHLQCTNPPLTKKPPTGYGWSCPPCSFRHEENVEKYRDGGDTPARPSSSKASSAPVMVKKPSAKGKETTEDAVASGRLKQTNGWPFRYFGQHSDPSTITDPHDSFYPRASTRVGHKFQISAIYLEGDADPADRPRRRGWNFSVKRERNGHPKAESSKSAKRDAEGPAERDRRKEKKDMRSFNVYTRGSEETSEVISIPLEDPEREGQLDALVEAAKKQTLYQTAGVVLVDRALALFHRANRSADSSLSGDVSPPTRHAKITLKELGLSAWSEAEIEKFSEGILEHNDDLEEVASTLPRKSMGDVVNYYYMNRVDMEQKLDRQHDDDKWADGVAPTGLVSDDAPAGIDADNESMAGPSPDADDPLGPCAICEAAEAVEWYKCPSGIGTSQYTSAQKVMCKDCSIRWRHYGSDFPPVAEEALRKAKAAKRRMPEAESPVQETSTITPRELTPPPPRAVAIPRPCVICKRMDPKASLATCSRCCLSGHFACCGIKETAYSDAWLCLMCQAWNVLRRPHPNTGCIVCPSRRLKGPSDPLTALDFYKPTVDNGFIHLICAIVHPETAFQDVSLMEPVEGTVSIPIARWQKECFVCNQNGSGVCIKCADCPRHFHVSCAWQSGFKFAFEMQTIKRKKSTQISDVQFQEESGVLEARIWCRSHKPKATRNLYELGAIDNATQMTALQTFVRHFKAPRPVETYAALRRGLRIDALVAPALRPEPLHEEEEPPPSAVAALDMPITPSGRPRPVKTKVSPVLSIHSARESTHRAGEGTHASARARRAAKAKSSGSQGNTPPEVLPMHPTKIKLRLPVRRTEALPLQPEADGSEILQADSSSTGSVSAFAEAGPSSAPYTPQLCGPFSPVNASPYKPEAVDYAMSATSSSESEDSDVETSTPAAAEITEDAHRLGAIEAAPVADVPPEISGSSATLPAYLPSATGEIALDLNAPLTLSEAHAAGTAGGSEMNDISDRIQDAQYQADQPLKHSAVIDMKRDTETSLSPALEPDMASTLLPTVNPAQMSKVNSSNAFEPSAAPDAEMRSELDSAPEPEPQFVADLTKEAEGIDATELHEDSMVITQALLDLQGENTHQSPEASDTSLSMEAAKAYAELNGHYEGREHWLEPSAPLGASSHASVAPTSSALAMAHVSGASPSDGPLLAMPHGSAAQLLSSHFEAIQPGHVHSPSALPLTDHALVPHPTMAHTLSEFSITSQYTDAHHVTAALDSSSHHSSQMDETVTSAAPGHHTVSAGPEHQGWPNTSVSVQPYTYYSMSGPSNGFYPQPSPPHHIAMPEPDIFPPSPGTPHSSTNMSPYGTPAEHNAMDYTSAGVKALSSTTSRRKRRSPIPANASCFNCATEETPVWRRDNEHHVLCNSCGQYWKAHGSHRPLTLKGPKRAINKYAPQGKPPPGAVIKNSPRDKAAQLQQNLPQQQHMMTSMHGGIPTAGSGAAYLPIPPPATQEPPRAARPLPWQLNPPRRKRIDPATGAPEERPPRPLPWQLNPSRRKRTDTASTSASQPTPPHSPFQTSPAQSQMPITQKSYQMAPQPSLWHQKRFGNGTSAAASLPAQTVEMPVDPALAELMRTMQAYPVSQGMHGPGMLQHHYQSHAMMTHEIEVDPALVELGEATMHGNHGEHQPQVHQMHMEQDWAQRFATAVLDQNSH